MLTLDASLSKLAKAVERGSSIAWCHRLWSDFIRLRDTRCLGCAATTRLTAHHIVRKCVVPSARFETGNGITLCRSCHKIPHAIFNGRPRLAEPLNARSGDDLDLAADAYEFLIDDAERRGILRDSYYFVSDTLLDWYRATQGFPEEPLSGTRIEQAARLIRSAPVSFYQRMGEAVITSLFVDDAYESLRVFNEVMSRRILH
ncbi:MAG: HNH endonuclease [bacterium]